MVAFERPAVLLIIASDWTDWLALGLMEIGLWGVPDPRSIFQVPIGDYLMRRRMTRLARLQIKHENAADFCNGLGVLVCGVS